MSRIFGRIGLTALLALSLLVPGVAAAEQCPALSAPTFKPHKKFKNKHKLKVTVEYLATYGHTVANGNGIFYHVAGAGVSKGSIFYPEQYWSDGYPLYLMGKPMSYRLHVKNLGKRAVTNIRIVAVQEYLEFFGFDGEDLGGCSTQEWIVPKIKPKSEWVGEATWTIPGGGYPGLNQTHVQIQRYYAGCFVKNIVYDNPQAGLFCPPE